MPQSWKNQGMGLNAESTIRLARLKLAIAPQYRKGGARWEVCRRAEQIITAARSDPSFDLEVGRGFLEGLEVFACSSLIVLGISLMFPREQRD